MKLQPLGRFSIGFTAGVAMATTLFFVVRRYCLSFVQTSELDSHYGVLYAGFSAEAVLVVACLLPLAIGIVTLQRIGKPLRLPIAIATVVAAGLSCFAILGLVFTLSSDAFLLGLH